MNNAKLVMREEFKQLVDIWNHKGHDHVVEVRFNGTTINLYCSYYVDPEKVFFINVIDTSELTTL